MDFKAMSRITIEINGTEPKGQPRPRTFRNGGRTITHSPHNDYYFRIRAEAIKARLKRHGGLPEGVAVEIAADIYFAVPPSLSKKEKAARLAKRYHTQTPDTDNLAKAILDAIVSAGLIADDRQVFRLNISKEWAEQNNTTIQIEWEEE
ncbi:MAG: RusA family crossover junction endodeoxyribonuclease [Elusimicrobiales bacterium]|nr:RusA family crossover junction endodeoxyribonuclease [Elusimicrobiales bacterium]